MPEYVQDDFFAQDDEKKCEYCGNKAEAVTVTRQHICIDCLYENEEYSKQFEEAG